FTGLRPGAPCGKISGPLWRSDLGLGYEPVSIYAAGFLDAEPDFDAIKRDALGRAEISARAPALTFWAAFFGLAKSDQIRLEIRDPQGQILSDRDITQERDRARQFYYVGRRLKSVELSPGAYTGIARISREVPGGAAMKRQVRRELKITASE
ncbi:MAG: M23 family metallopeptidase, partial [Gammaproteobacteria bacterium]